MSMMTKMTIDEVWQQADTGHPDLPRMEDYGICRSEVMEYLQQKRAIIDSEGSLKSQYALFLILWALPVIIAASLPADRLPWGRNTIAFSVVMGFILGCVGKGMSAFVRRQRLKRHMDRRVERYLTDILNSKKQK